MTHSSKTPDVRLDVSGSTRLPTLTDDSGPCRVWVRKPVYVNVPKLRVRDCVSLVSSEYRRESKNVRLESVTFSSGAT